MTKPLFLEDAYRKETQAIVERILPDGSVICDVSIFYARGGGQPGDAGQLSWHGGDAAVAEAIKGEEGAIVLALPDDAPRPTVGAEVTQAIDWDRRHRHMRVHTALHLLSVVIPLPVTGGAITDVKGRLDFDMPNAPEDKDKLQSMLDDLIARDLPTGETWVSEAELDANPSLVKTMSVQPPRGSGQVRLVWIGEGSDQVDLQPCGGTHVMRTGEIGPVTIGKIEKKGARNRRVNLLLE